MAKKNKDTKRGLGRGLDSLIPKIDDGEEEKSNKSSLTLEDILSNSKEETDEIEEETEEKKSEKEEKEKKNEEKEEKIEKEKTPNEENEDKVSKSEEISTNKDEELAKETAETKEETAESEENVDITTEKIIEENEEIKKDEKEEDKELVLSDYELASIDEVKEIIEKNPRITLWSAKSSAVFRYLRKTRPEFSISKEASELIDKAVSEKYPEIWKLFEDL